MVTSLKIVLKLVVLLMAIVSTFAKATQGIEIARGVEIARSTKSELGYPIPNPNQVLVPVCCPRIPECCRLEVTHP